MNKRLTRYGVLSGTLPIVYCWQCVMCFVESANKAKKEYLYLFEKEEMQCSSCGVLSFPVINPTVFHSSVIN